MGGAAAPLLPQAQCDVATRHVRWQHTPGEVQRTKVTFFLPVVYRRARRRFHPRSRPRVFISRHTDHCLLLVSTKFRVLVLPNGIVVSADYTSHRLSSHSEGVRATERNKERVRKEGRGRTERRSEKEREGERHESKDETISHKKRRKVGRGEASKREGKKGIEKSMRKRGRRGLHFELALANLAED